VVTNSHRFRSRYLLVQHQAFITSKGHLICCFPKKAASDASLLLSDDDIELFDLKQGYLSMPKESVAGLPNVAGQVFSGLHFLSVAKVLKSVMTHRKIPEIMKSRGVLVKRKDSMSLYTLTVNIKGADLASTTAKVQEMDMLDGFNSACLCAGIHKLFE